MSRNWSDEQLAIFGFFRDGRGNLVCRARAGTGKTTTILEGIKHAPERARIVCAFNKRIADELRAKVDGAAEVKTLHGIGFSVIQRYWEGVRLDDKRGWELAREAAGEQSPDDMIKKVAKLAGIGKGTGIHPDDPELYDELLELGIRFDIEPDDEWIEAGWTLERVAQCAILAMQKAREREERPRIDFDDMIYLPLANRWARPRYDLVVVDEAQDMNAAQLELAQRVCMEHGRIVVVGDDRQAIYGFRGADSNALDRLKTALKAKELSLTTTYRCGKAIVSLAQRLVPDFRAHESNGPGEVTTLGHGIAPLLEAAELGDFVLSRKNAPLVRVCLRLLRKGKAARIEGRDVASQLKTIVTRWKGVRNVEQLVDRIERWKEKEHARAMKHGDTPATQEKIAQINDQAEVLNALCDGIALPDELLARLETMFGDSDTDRRPMVVCSSIHRSKGLEADRVFILKETLYPNRAWDKKRGEDPGPDPIEEQNLEYVAITRAKKTLVWVPTLNL